jgi:hypothetical protein
LAHHNTEQSAALHGAAQRPDCPRFTHLPHARISGRSNAFDRAAPFKAPTCSDDFGAASYISPPP